MGQGRVSQTRVSVTKESLKQRPLEETWFPTCPQPFWRRDFIRVFLVCDPSILPHLSLAANTQLLGYLSRAPIKSCHSASQHPSANHTRAPTHVQPIATLITFKYFHRWPLSRCEWTQIGFKPHYIPFKRVKGSFGKELRVIANHLNPCSSSANRNYLWLPFAGLITCLMWNVFRFVFLYNESHNSKY